MYYRAHWISLIFHASKVPDLGRVRCFVQCENAIEISETGKVRDSKNPRVSVSLVEVLTRISESQTGSE